MQSAGDQGQEQEQHNQHIRYVKIRGRVGGLRSCTTREGYRCHHRRGIEFPETYSDPDTQSQHDGRDNLKIIFNSMDMETFCLLYKALVRPHLEHASSV